MAIQQFRVRGGLLTDDTMKFSSKANSGTATGSAINNMTSITAASAQGEILVLDGTSQIAYRTAAQLKTDLGLALTLGQGDGIAFSTGGTQQDSITFGSSTQLVSLELPATLSASSGNSKGTAGSGSSAGTGHSHTITASDDTSGGGGAAILKSTSDGDLTLRDVAFRAGTVSGGLTVAGDLTVSGTTTTVSSTNTTIADPIFVLNKGATQGNNLIDTGLLLESPTAGANAAFIWSANDDRFEMFKGTIDGNVVTFTDDSKTFADLKLNKITFVDPGVSMVTPGLVNITSTSASSSATTGALQVAGGVGIGGAVNVTGNITTAAGGIFNGTTDSTATNVGALKTAGGLGVVKAATIGGRINAKDAGESIRIDGLVNVASTTAATGSTNAVTGGSIFTAGGIAVAGHSIFQEGIEILEPASGINDKEALGIRGGFINVATSLASTSSATGALRVGGGVGVVGNINAGGSIASGGTLTASGTTDTWADGSSAIATSGSFTGSAVFNGGLGVKKKAAIGTDLYVYRKFYLQDKAIGSGTGTVNTAFMVPFKSGNVTDSGSATFVASIAKADFTTAEVTLQGKSSSGDVFSAKMVITQDGGTNITHTIYAETNVGALPAGHAYSVLFGDATGGSTNTNFVVLKYAHTKSSTTYAISGVALCTANA